MPIAMPNVVSPVPNPVETDASSPEVTMSPSNLRVKQVHEWFLPKQPDTLFWCLFIAQHGLAEYQQVDRNYGVREMEIKRLVGEYITERPFVFKETEQKITKIGIQEIRSELLTSAKETSLPCLVALCLYYKCNVILIDDTERFFLEYHGVESEVDDEVPWYVFKRNSFGKYSVLLTDQRMNGRYVTEVWKKGKYRILNPQKPVKSMTAFRREELQELAKQVGGNGDLLCKMKKTELYQRVVDGIKWF